jgi:hypothetical protein
MDDSFIPTSFDLVYLPWNAKLPDLLQVFPKRRRKELHSTGKKYERKRKVSR